MSSVLFQSKNRTAPVKFVIFSAPNCSGKSYWFRKLSKRSEFREFCIYEMDDLRYFSEDRIAEQLPTAWRQFEHWSQAQKDTDVLEELRQNIRVSNREQQLIKLKFVELATGDRRVVTVNPEALRHSSEGIRFHELIEEQFDVSIRHVLMVPSLPRYQLNLFYRERLKKTDRGFEERALLRSKIELFECVVHVGLFTGSQRFAREVLSQFSRADGNLHSGPRYVDP